MKNKKIRSLAGQFFAFVSLIVISAMSINAFIHYKSETLNINNTLYSHGKSLSELLASISIEPLLIYDDVTLNDYAAFTSQQENIVFAAVVSKEKVSLTHFLNKKNSYIKNIKGSEEAVDIQPILNELKSHESISFVESPVKFKEKIIAYAWVGLDRKPYEEKSLNALIKIILISCAISLFIGGAIYSLFRFKIFQPIEQLTKSAKDIAKLKFESSVDIQGKGELSVLADTFERMRIQLKDLIGSRNKVLQQLGLLNDSLEERVAERTSELQVLNTKIAHQAMHDPLTGLPNRVLIVEKLQQEISHAMRDRNDLAVFMIDLNNFKDVNDTLGHPVGDVLLKEVADRIKNSLRESDTVGRLGGDEFAVVLPNVTQEKAVQVAEKILYKLQPSFNIENDVLKIGASIGIVICPEHGGDHTSLIRLADLAMYEAKKNNINISVYRPELDQLTRKRMALLNDLREALDKDQLELHYQPKISLVEEKVLSVEALIRWNHHTNGWIPPDEFIVLAENNDLINQVSYWVLQHVFKQWREWKDAGLNLQISLNLSARNLIDPKLPAYVAALYGQYQVTDGAIKAEITESAVMSNPEVVMAMMESPEMKKMLFSIDDFGTGYSSLSYLKKLTVSEVKIDKTFVFDMASDEDDESIVRSVIDLAHNLGHSVVAEGVETREVLERLIEMGCDEVQGYYFSKAVRNTELRAVIRDIESQFGAVSFLKMKKD